MTVTASELKMTIRRTLLAQGFVLTKHGIAAQTNTSKDDMRRLHSLSVEHKRNLARAALKKHESSLLARFATAESVDRMHIEPYLVEVQPDSHDEKLFRYASLHWSIPVSTGYGRRLRFLVVDRNNDKLIGIIGLGDPVYSLRSRDQWIGWSAEAKRSRLRNVMDAFVLGAVQPYSQLLCGKLVAMLVASSDINDAFVRKYGSRASLISRTESSAPLVLVTTLSALGRSSIYNRLTLDGKRLYNSLGFSKGSGDFHFTNGTYKAIFNYATEHCSWTAKNPLWGTGSRNRREVVRKCLQQLGLRDELMYHGVCREVYAIPLAANTKRFLCGIDNQVVVQARSTDSIAEAFRSRWLDRSPEHSRPLIAFDPRSIALWTANLGYTENLHAQY